MELWYICSKVSYLLMTPKCKNLLEKPSYSLRKNDDSRFKARVPGEKSHPNDNLQENKNKPENKCNVHFKAYLSLL